MFTTVDGLKVYFEVHGQGKEILILPGWQETTKSFSPVIPFLEKNFKIILPDLPGFGQSETPPAWNLDSYALFVGEFIKDLGVEKPVILGHSFGGSIGIKLAVNYPDFLSKLILTSTSGIRRLTLKKIIGYFLAKSGKSIFKLPILKPYYQIGRNILYRIINEPDYIASNHLKQSFLNIIKEDLSARLKKIQVPTLIIWGENDSLVPIAHGKLLAREIPNSKLAILKNAGHFVFIDKPEEFSLTVKKFIDEKS